MGVPTTRMTTCPTCAHQISTSALSCPQCGATNAKQHGVFYYVFWTLASLVAISVLLPVGCVILGVGAGAFLQGREEALRRTQSESNKVEAVTESAPNTAAQKLQNQRYEEEARNRLLEDELRREREAAALAQQRETARRQTEANARAFQFYAPKATNGDAFAQCRLGEFYLSGKGVSQDRALAERWLSTSSRAGNLEASNLLFLHFDSTRASK